jgi:PAS domain S-box-containing protein
MITPLIPPNEVDRLEDLYAYGVMDSAPEKIFDDIAALAAQICGTRYAAITFIDSYRHWFKAEYGLAFGTSSRKESICGHAILARELFEVADTWSHPCFSDNAKLNQAKVRFYSGSQLNSSRGNSIGMLCVMDSEPRSLSTSQKQSLVQLAGVLMALLEAARQRRLLSWLSHLVDAVTDEVLVLDCISLNYLYANAIALRSLGFSLEQMRRMTPLDVTPDTDRDRLMAYVRQLQNGAQQVQFESVRRRHDGALFPVEVRWQMLPNLGRPVILSIVHDITERQQINNMKSEFISVVSHELRTPLTAIHGALKLLDTGVAGPLPDTAVKLLNRAAQNTDRLCKMVDDILDLEKLASGEMQFELQPLLASAVLEQVAQTYAALASVAGVQLHLQATPNLCLFGDAQRLNQVLANLVSNALKFAPRGSSVSVSAFAACDLVLFATQLGAVPSSPAAAVRLQVSDSGPGIPEHFRHNIFQRFAQANMQTNRQTGGSGLGLFMAKQMVEQMHGSISYNSQPGCTTFEVILPEAKVKAKA